MTVVAVQPVTLDELRMLFTGEHLPDDQPDQGVDGWATRPFYSPVIALEICRRTDPQTEGQLRMTVFGTFAVESLPPLAVEACKTGFARYRETRGNRGL